MLFFFAELHTFSDLKNWNIKNMVPFQNKIPLLVDMSAKR